MLYPNEIIIHDGNAHLFVNPPKGQGKGLVPRNYQTHPLGCYGSILPYTAVDFPIIPAGDRSAVAKEQAERGNRCSDIRMQGNNGAKIPSRDQNGKGYCWAHSGVSALLVTRAGMNLKYADLSAYAVACVIKNYRDEGGWGAQGVDFLASRGVPTSEFWAQQSMSRANDKPETWANARLNRVTSGWIDLQAAQYDRNLTWDQYLSLWLSSCSTVNDYNWWSHSVGGMDGVDGAQEWGRTRNPDSGKLLQLAEFNRVWAMDDPVTAGWGCRIWNSWGDSWSTDGMGVLTGKQAVPDGGVGLLSAVASAA